LSGDGVPCAAICKFPHSIRVVAADFLRRLELDQAAESISGELAKQTALGTA